jgi:hypothetical protein
VGGRDLVPALRRARASAVDREPQHPK